MPNDDISVASAASGVVAISINGLLAQRAGDLFFQQWKSEAISNGSAENSRLQKVSRPSSSDGTAVMKPLA